MQRWTHTQSHTQTGTTNIHLVYKGLSYAKCKNIWWPGHPAAHMRQLNIVPRVILTRCWHQFERLWYTLASVADSRTYFQPEYCSAKASQNLTQKYNVIWVTRDKNSSIQIARWPSRSNGCQRGVTMVVNWGGNVHLTFAIENAADRVAEI